MSSIGPLVSIEWRTWGKTKLTISTFVQQRARLRRNQRNSRARKQAYIEDLEQRWNVCLKAGARATEEMQKEARRVHEENLVLRALLRERGIDDDHIVRVLSSTGRSPAKVSERSSVIRKEDMIADLPRGFKLNLDARSDCCGPGQSCPVPTTQITEPPAAMSQKGSVVSQTPPDQHLPLPKDSPISWDLYGWLNDLSQIKDAFGTGNEVCIPWRLHFFYHGGG